MKYLYGARREKKGGEAAGNRREEPTISKGIRDFRKRGWGIFIL
jgi:hypothetical protein